MIVPASSEEKVQFGVESIVGVVTAVTPVITGAVVSVVVVVSFEVVVLSLDADEPPSSLLAHEMIVKLISSEKNMSKFLIGSLIG